MRLASRLEDCMLQKWTQDRDYQKNIWVSFQIKSTFLLVGQHTWHMKWVITGSSSNIFHVLQSKTRREHYSIPPQKGLGLFLRRIKRWIWLCCQLWAVSLKHVWIKSCQGLVDRFQGGPTADLLTTQKHKKAWISSYFSSCLKMCW